MPTGRILTALTAPKLEDEFAFQSIFPARFHSDGRGGVPETTPSHTHLSNFIAFRGTSFFLYSPHTPIP